jgi:hypothetical protein
MEGKEYKKKNDEKAADNVINISIRRGTNFYVFLTKKFFNDFETVELHSIGNAMPIAVETAENLERYVFPFNQLATNTPSLRNWSQTQSKCLREAQEEPSSSLLLRSTPTLKTH